MSGVYQEAHRRCSSPIRDLGYRMSCLMFLANAAFYCVTTFFIWRHRRGMSVTRREPRSLRRTWRSWVIMQFKNSLCISVNSKSLLWTQLCNWARVKLFGKLFVGMGVTTLSVSLDYFFGSSDPLSTISVAFRFVHFMPIFSMLFIFWFNEKNKRLVAQKYPRFAGQLYTS